MRKYTIVLVALFLPWVVGCTKSSPPTVELQGVVELTERALAFELPGRVVDVKVERGDRLEKGVLIARLDSQLEELSLQSLRSQARATKADLQLLYEGSRPEEIEQARARLRGSEASLRANRFDWQRAQSLYVNDSIPKSELDAARSRLDQSVAQTDEARNRLKELRVGPRAQEIQAGEARLEAAEASAASSEERIHRHLLFSDGLSEVLDVPIRFGEFVSPGTTVVTVADTTRPFVEVFVPQGRMGEVRMGMPVRVLSDSLKGHLGGRVEHISRTMEFTPRYLFSPTERPYLVLRVRVKIADPERQIHAGLPAFVQLLPPDTQVALPPEIVHRRPDTHLRDAVKEPPVSKKEHEVQAKPKKTP